MKRVVVSILLLYLGWCYGQEEEGCISNLPELENALLSNPVNQYQIARAYFPPRREITPVCVTSYYYIGVSISDVVKQSCPTHLTSDEDKALTGCSMWKWCINSFYMGLNLAQLQDFSLFILLDETSEVELELPPVCNMTNTILYEYLLRITMLLYHYARDKGQLGKGTEFIGYAARFLSNSDLEKLALEAKPSSIDALSENENSSIDLYMLDTVILFISLLALPRFPSHFAKFAYDYVKCIQELKEHNKKNLKYMMCSLVIICCIANGAMTFFQASALQRKYEWFYLYPYMTLWISIILNFFHLMTKVHMLKRANRVFKLPFYVDGTLLWIFTMTAQLASWHLVFVLCGLILNPLRAVFYSVVIVVAAVCCVVGLAAVIKLFLAPCTSKCTWKSFSLTHLQLMISLVLLLIYTFTYSVFVLQISITSGYSNHVANQTVDDIIKIILPGAFLTVIAWFLTVLLKEGQS